MFVVLLAVMCSITLHSNSEYKKKNLIKVCVLGIYTQTNFCNMFAVYGHRVTL
jgi:hypothetical protein